METFPETLTKQEKEFLEAGKKFRIFLVWERKENNWSLRSVDTKKEWADLHKILIKNENKALGTNAEVIIETRVANHCFGHEDIITLSQETKLKEKDGKPSEEEK